VGDISIQATRCSSEQKYLIEVTSQPRATADLHIRDPKNPLPPQTTNRLVVGAAIGDFVADRGDVG
jgi:hypothetical protein